MKKSHALRDMTKRKLTEGELPAPSPKRIRPKLSESIAKWRDNPFLVLAEDERSIVDISEEGRALMVRMADNGSSTIPDVAKALGISNRKLTNLRKQVEELDEILCGAEMERENRLKQKLYDQAMEHDGKGPNQAAMFLLERDHGWTKDRTEDKTPQVNVAIVFPESMDRKEFQAKYGGEVKQLTSSGEKEDGNES